MRILCQLPPLKGLSFAPAAVGLGNARFATGLAPVAIFFGNSSHLAEAAVRECISDLDAVAFMAAAFFWGNFLVGNMQKILRLDRPETH